MGGGTLDISEARKEFNRLDERLDTEPLIYITRHGRKAFAVVNVEYMRTVLETIDILSDPEALDTLRRSMEDIREGRLHDHAEVEQELG